MTKGVIFLAPGQHQEVIDGIKKRDFAVEIDSNLEVDASFGTPVARKVLFEFKEVPHDLAASIRQSGRMSRQNIALGVNEGPSFLMQIGYPVWAWEFDRVTGERHKMMIDPNEHGPHRYTGITYGEYQGRMLTLIMTGVMPITVPAWEDVAETLCGYYSEFQAKAHRSHLIRPNFAGSGIMTSWPKPRRGDLILHILQGLQGVGYQKAKDMWKHFGSIRMMLLADEKELSRISGIGKMTARKILEQIDAKYDDYFKDGE